jgi:hypothetical protein
MAAWTLSEIGRSVARRRRRRRQGVAAEYSVASGLYLSLLGVLVVVVAQYLSAVVVGPAVRWLFGEPRDFMSDYTSPEAFLQGTIVQVSVLGGGFLSLGVLAGVRRLIHRPSQAFWAANPLTLFLGLFLSFLYHQAALLNDVPYEYAGVSLWALHVVAFGVYARLLLLGASSATRRPAGDTGIQVGDG